MLLGIGPFTYSFLYFPPQIVQMRPKNIPKDNRTNNCTFVFIFLYRFQLFFSIARHCTPPKDNPWSINNNFLPTGYLIYKQWTKQNWFMRITYSSPLAADNICLVCYLEEGNERLPLDLTSSCIQVAHQTREYLGFLSSAKLKQSWDK